MDELHFPEAQQEQLVALAHEVKACSMELQDDVSTRLDIAKAEIGRREASGESPEGGSLAWVKDLENLRYHSQQAHAAAYDLEHVFDTEEDKLHLPASSLSETEAVTKLTKELYQWEGALHAFSATYLTKQADPACEKAMGQCMQFGQKLVAAGIGNHLGERLYMRIDNYVQYLVPLMKGQAAVGDAESQWTRKAGQVLIALQQYAGARAEMTDPFDARAAFAPLTILAREFRHPDAVRVPLNPADANRFVQSIAQFGRIFTSLGQANRLNDLANYREPPGTGR